MNDMKREIEPSLYNTQFKIISNIIHLIAAGFGCVILILGMIGSLLIMGLTQNHLGWITMLVAVLFTLYIFVLSFWIDKKIRLINQK